jgi:hypothetical protein
MTSPYTSQEFLASHLTELALGNARAIGRSTPVASPGHYSVRSSRSRTARRD